MHTHILISMLIQLLHFISKRTYLSAIASHLLLFILQLVSESEVIYLKLLSLLAVCCELVFEVVVAVLEPFYLLLEKLFKLFDVFFFIFIVFKDLF